MYDFIDNNLLSRLGSLPIESRVPMLGNVAGKHRSPHRGSSVEFAESALSGELLEGIPHLVHTTRRHLPDQGKKKPEKVVVT